MNVDFLLRKRHVNAVFGEGVQEHQSQVTGDLQPERWFGHPRAGHQVKGRVSEVRQSGKRGRVLEHVRMPPGSRDHQRSNLLKIRLIAYPHLGYIQICISDIDRDTSFAWQPI
jgi:hypothetical protein